MASNGHFLTHIPHPTQSSSEMEAAFFLSTSEAAPDEAASSSTSTHCLPTLTTGQKRTHSWPHLKRRKIN